jgi:serine/threonine protein phosphatase PrpC
MVIDGFDGYLKTLPQSYPPGLAIREAAAQTNSSIVAAANAPDSLHRHMGSTVVLALVQQSALGTQAWIGHIGDSRAYLVRDGRISRITHDHSAVQVLLDRNLITPEEAFHHPDASVLTRSLGHRAEVDIDVKQVSLQAGDSLLLCSDGLWGYVPGEAIEAVAIAPDFTVEAAAKALLELALDAGGHDNIGIELARLSSPAGATVLDM